METSKQHWLGLLVIPIEMILGNLVIPLFPIKDHPVLAVYLSTGIAVLAFLTMIVLFKDFLVQQWRLYRQKIIRNLLISLVLVVGAVLLLQVTRKIIPAELLTQRTSTSSTDLTSGLKITAWLSVVGAIAPFLAPFAEELTFRYLLLGKMPTKLIKAIMLIVQGILFGLIHYYNFNGNVIATIPYMVIGIYFGIIYLAFQNIWGSIVVHWIFNSINSMLPALVLLILSFFGIHTS